MENPSLIQVIQGAVSVALPRSPSLFLSVSLTLSLSLCLSSFSAPPSPLPAAALAKVIQHRVVREPQLFQRRESIEHVHVSPGRNRIVNLRGHIGVSSRETHMCVSA